MTRAQDLNQQLKEAEIQDRLASAREKLSVAQEKVQKIAQQKAHAAMDLKLKELDVKAMEVGKGRFDSDIGELLQIASAHCIDNTRTIMSDPVFKSIWEYDELEEIKHLIMKKARNL